MSDSAEEPTDDDETQGDEPSGPTAQTADAIARLTGIPRQSGIDAMRSLAESVDRQRSPILRALAEMQRINVVAATMVSPKLGLNLQEVRQFQAAFAHQRRFDARVRQHVAQVAAVNRLVAEWGPPSPLAEVQRTLAALGRPTIRPLGTLLDPKELKRLSERFQPRNLRESNVPIRDALRLMRDEGIPLFLVPDPETALALVTAGGPAERRAVLVDRAQHVFRACEDIIDLCTSADLAIYGSFLRRAIAGYDAFHEGTQAMAANVLDTLVNRHANKGQLVNPETGHAFIRALPHRDGFALMPLPKAHARYYPQNGQKPGSAFTRHGTVHGVGPEQYHPANAVHALMLATSMLGYLAGLW